MIHTLDEWLLILGLTVVVVVIILVTIIPVNHQAVYIRY